LKSYPADQNIPVTTEPEDYSLWAQKPTTCLYSERTQSTSYLDNIFLQAPF